MYGIHGLGVYDDVHDGLSGLVINRDFDILPWFYLFVRVDPLRGPKIKGLTLDVHG